MAKDQTTEPSASSISMKHLRLGWLVLTVFALAGLILEALHGFKVAWYLDVGNETRHTMLRLGHAHGTFLGLLNVAFAVTIDREPLMALPLGSGESTGRCGQYSLACRVYPRRSISI